MASKQKGEAAAAVIATNDEEWAATIAEPGLRVVDVFAKWAGPCDSMVSIFKRLKQTHHDSLHITQAASDEIEALAKFKNKSSPTFLFYYDGVLVNIVRGANGPLVEAIVKEQMLLEQQGAAHKPVIRPMENLHPVATLDENDTEHTFAFIKPDGMAPSKLDAIMDVIRLHRFEVAQKRKIWLDRTLVDRIYKDHVSEVYFEHLCNYLTSAPILCLILKKENAVQAWRDLVGPFSSIQAKDSAPSSIRALFGTDSRINAVYGAENHQVVIDMKLLLFDPNLKTLSTDNDKSFGVQKSLVIIKPSLLKGAKQDAVIDRIICKGFHVTKREEITLTLEVAHELYPKLGEEAIEYLTSDPVLALVVTGECAIHELAEMIGPEDPEVCKETCPMSIRALFGLDLVHNGIHSSETVEDATHEINILFPMVLKTGTMSSKPDLNNIPKLERTLALIKPDAYGSGKTEEILKAIEDSGFSFIKQSEIHMTLGKAREFYKEHDGKPFYETLTTWMSSAPIYAIVLEKSNAINEWRQLAGPTNSNTARETVPHSIRARFGTDGSLNAVHGSDSPESAEREIKVIFEEEVSLAPEFEGGKSRPSSAKSIRPQSAALIKKSNQKIAEIANEEAKHEAALKASSNVNLDSSSKPLSQLKLASRSSSAKIASQQSPKLASRPASQIKLDQATTGSKVKLASRPASQARLSQAAVENNMASSPRSSSKNLAAKSSSSIRQPAPPAGSAPISPRTGTSIPASKSASASKTELKSSKASLKG